MQLDAIPDVEWWDAPLLTTRSYDDVSGGSYDVLGDKITLYVEHPVMIEPPTETGQSNAEIVIPLYLTKQARPAPPRAAPCPIAVTEPAGTHAPFTAAPAAPPLRNPPANAPRRLKSVQHTCAAPRRC